MAITANIYNSLEDTLAVHLIVGANRIKQTVTAGKSLINQ